MVDIGFFILGLVNSVLLILIFLLRKNRLNLVKRFNWIYLLLIIPTVVGVFWTTLIELSIRHAIFLGLFLGFLILEWLLDFVIQIIVNIWSHPKSTPQSSQ